MTNINEKIKEKQKQAIDREITDKAEFIANALGKYEKANWRGREAYYEERKGTFRDKNFRITTVFNSVNGYSSDGMWGNSSSKTTILYKEKKVFEADDDWGHGGIKTYLPGAWEKSLESLNTAAQEKEAAKERKAAAAEKRIQAREDAAARKEARKNFGL